jgi:hypothetical protein
MLISIEPLKKLVSFFQLMVSNPGLFFQFCEVTSIGEKPHEATLEHRKSNT